MVMVYKKNEKYELINMLPYQREGWGLTEMKKIYMQVMDQIRYIF